MKFTGVRKSWHGVAGLIVLSAFLSLEFYTNLFEKSVGYYLKWQNHKRPQLGRMWERDRQSLVAQAKIKSIRSSLDLQEETALGISSFKHLFEGLSPGFPLVVSREKFLQLYYDFPGQWSEQIISSYDLIDLDSRKNWDRVFLKRFGPWITLQFIDRQNIPIHELFLSVDTLFEVQATRTVKRGTLKMRGLLQNRIFSDFRVSSCFKISGRNHPKSSFPGTTLVFGERIIMSPVWVFRICLLENFQQHLAVWG